MATQAPNLSIKILISSYSVQQLHGTVENLIAQIKQDFLSPQTQNYVSILREILETTPKDGKLDTKIVNRIETEICDEILSRLTDDELIQKFRKLSDVTLVTKKLCIIFRQGETGISKWADQSVLSLLQYFQNVSKGADPPETALNPTIQLETLKKIFESDSSNHFEFFDHFWLKFETSLDLILSTCNSKLAAYILVDVCPKFLKHVLTEKRIRFGLILFKRMESYFKFSYVDCQSQGVGVGYMILCNLLDYVTREHLIPSQFIKEEILEKDNLRLLIQFGLIHENSLYRKRVLYILKQIVSCIENGGIVSTNFFRSDENFSWEYYILIIETLEETQVHVIKPVLLKMEFLLLTKDNELNLHWLTTIFQRMFMHEAKFIKKWAVLKFLNMSLNKESLIDPRITEFVYVPLLNALNDPALFARSKEECRGRVSTTALALSNFLKHCAVVLDGTFLVSFFSSLIARMRMINWAPVPLMYLSYSLSTLPPTPAWNLNALMELKELVIDSLRTQEKYLKIAIHCFLFEAFRNLVKKEELTFNSLSSILLPFAQYGAWRRNTNLWRHSVSWLQNSPPCLLTPENAIQFLHEMISEFNSEANLLHNDLYFTDVVAERVSHILTLCLDAGWLCLGSSNKTLDASYALDTLTAVLLSMNSRPYIPIGKVDRSLKFVTCLLQDVSYTFKEPDEDSVRKSVHQWLHPCMTSIVDYAVDRIAAHVDKMEDVERIDMYLKLLKQLTDVYSESTEVYNCFNKLADISLLHFDNGLDETLGSKLKRFCALKCLAWMVEIIQNHSNPMIWKSTTNRIIYFIRHKLQHTVFTEPLDKWPSTNENKESGDAHLKQRGKLVSEYISYVWTCLAFYTTKYNSEIDVIFLAEAALHSLEIGTDVIPSVCNCIKIIFAEVLNNDVNLFSKVLDFVWTISFERRKTDVFWNSIKSFLELAFQPAILLHSNAHILIQYCEKAHSLSDTCPTIFHMFVFHCFDLWKSLTTTDHLKIHAQFITNALIYGSVHRKDQKGSNDANAFVHSLGKICAVNSLMESDHLDEVSVRAAAVSLAINLGYGHPLITDLVNALLAEDDRLTSNRSRYYANSLTHLKKNRIWQTLLVLEPLCDEGLVIVLLSGVYKQLMEEGSQLSIRLLQEWLATRILLGFSALRNDLWSQLEMAAKIRVGSVGSFLAIIYHVGKLLDSSHQLDFISKAFHHVLPWCMAQNFNTRVTAQVVFHKLWEICESNNYMQMIETYKPIELSLKSSHQSGNAAKCTEKIMENFYFKKFDGVKHFTLQTIFYDIPRLTFLSDYEWIPVNVFAKFYANNSGSIKMLNDSTELKDCVTDEYKESIDEKDDKNLDVANGNVQKKITPWKRLLSEEGLLWMNEQDTNNKGELIVVASLIDRIPNLGGLCRSCEIFGAKEYILSNVKCIEDKQFQNLSVSAEKWVSISEVKAYQLKEYLLQKKIEGYTLVGAEQTTESILVHNYKFPRKTVLILGNEKEGIPVSLIQLLDVCVAIAQHGVIRSLNVHVCGALLIWEYSRQNIQINS